MTCTKCNSTGFITWIDQTTGFPYERKAKCDICAWFGAHSCKESNTCECYLLADEPAENCPVHGYGNWPPRCAECGKFMKRPPSPDAPAPKVYDEALATNGMQYGVKGEE
jgi:hypothetical protein